MKISSGPEEIFDKSAPYYNDNFKMNGFKFKISYNPDPPIK